MRMKFEFGSNFATKFLTSSLPTNGNLIALILFNIYIYFFGSLSCWTWWVEEAVGRWCGWAALQVLPCSNYPCWAGNGWGSCSLRAWHYRHNFSTNISFSFLFFHFLSLSSGCKRSREAPATFLEALELHILALHTSGCALYFWKMIGHHLACSICFNFKQRFLSRNMLQLSLPLPLSLIWKWETRRSEAREKIDAQCF